MRRYCLFASAIFIGLQLLAGGDQIAKPRPHLQPPPPGVVELTDIPTDGGIVKLNDGALLLVQAVDSGGGTQPRHKRLIYRVSKDGGKAWTKPRPLNCDINTEPLESTGMIRLKDGALALYAGTINNWHFGLSRDEGTTWQTSRIDAYPDLEVMDHALIQLQSGRLVLTGAWMGLMPYYPDLDRLTDTGWGWWRGRKLYMEGERPPYLIMGLIYYSDDEGKTWKQDRSAGLFGWFDQEGVPNGYGGATEVDETTSAETEDGRVLLFGRSKIGRLVQSYSSDGGNTWNSVQPTELASSQSPPLLIRVPKTGDLICVWNQASGEEIRRGMLRNRLSVAISQDSGISWTHFKNIEISEGVANVSYVPPEFPIARQILGRPGLGQLPDGFAMFTYSNMDIIGDKVFIRYSRMWPELKKGESAGTAVLPTTTSPEDIKAGAEMKGESVMRIYPLDWFYH